MNNKIAISFVLLLSLSLSACGKQAEKVVEDQAPVQKETVVESKSLLDWIKGGKTVECVIKSPETDIIIQTQGDAVRMEGIPYSSPDSSGQMPEPGNGILLAIGDWTYMWDKTSKKGTKMNLVELEKLSPAEQTEREDWSDMAEEWDEAGFAYDCREIAAVDEDFKAPEDVEFEDLNQIMKSFSDMSGKLQEQAEDGEVIDTAELEKMMKDAQQ